MAQFLCGIASFPRVDFCRTLKRLPGNGGSRAARRRKDELSLSRCPGPKSFPEEYWVSIYNNTGGRHRSVGIATRYGLEGPGIESRWGRDFLHPSRTALGPTQPPIQWVPGIYWGKAVGAWR